MTIQNDQIIGELVAKDYRTASVFKKHNIDFCCQGNRTITDACNSKDINDQQVVAELNSLLNSETDSTVDYQTWPLDLLADYIERKHHRYVEDKTQEILPYLDKIARVHGDRHPELHEINTHFKITAGELASHMKKEELMVFPYIKKMVQSQKEATAIQQPIFESVVHPIEAMMQEHTNEGDRFRKIEELSNNYTAPEDGCNTYKVTYALLKEFEQDLHLHIHLENNILFPKAIELEKLLN